MTSGLAIPADYDGERAYVLFTDRQVTRTHRSFDPKGAPEAVASRLLEERVSLSETHKTFASPDRRRVAAVTSSRVPVTTHFARSLIGSEETSPYCGCAVRSASVDGLVQQAAYEHGSGPLGHTEGRVVVCDLDTGMSEYSETGIRKSLEHAHAFGSGWRFMFEDLAVEPFDANVDIDEACERGYELFIGAIARDPYSSGIDLTVLHERGLVRAMVSPPHLDFDRVAYLRGFRMPSNAERLDSIERIYRSKADEWLIEI